MNKCSIYKLDTSFDDPFLPVINGIVKQSQNNGDYFGIRSAVASKISSTNGYFKVRGQSSPLNEYTLQAGAVSSVYFEVDKDAIITISGKYDLTLIDSNFLIPADIKYSKLLTCAFASGSINGIEKNALLSTVTLAGTCEGNIAILSSLQNLKNLTVTTKSVVGDIASISNLSVDRFDIWKSGISGSIEDYVAGRASVEQEGTVTIPGMFNVLTFGGSKPQYDCRLLTWKSATKMYCYDGTSEESSTTILAKGCSAEEIAAWENAGKTVVVIN